MKFVVDANVILSALIADSMTRRLLVEFEDDLLTPVYVHEELENHIDLVVEKSGLTSTEVASLIETIFTYVDVVPRSEVLGSLHEASRCMRDVDPDDALYLATAIERDATIWSDDRDYREQELVPVTTTGEMVDRLEEQSG